MCLSSCYFFSDNKKASHVIVLLVLAVSYTHLRAHET